MIFSQRRPQRTFSQLEEGKKEVQEDLKHVMKTCPNRGHIFKNKLQNTWTAILKTSAPLRFKVTMFNMYGQR